MINNKPRYNLVCYITNKKFVCSMLLIYFILEAPMHLLNQIIAYFNRDYYFALNLSIPIGIKIVFILLVILLVSLLYILKVFTLVISMLTTNTSIKQIWRVIKYILRFHILDVFKIELIYVAAQILSVSIGNWIEQLTNTNNFFYKLLSYPFMYGLGLLIVPYYYLRYKEIFLNASEKSIC